LIVCCDSGVISAVVDRFSFKFVDAMFSHREVGERYYQGIQDKTVGSFMPAHTRLRLDKNISGISAIPGSLDGKGKFVPAGKTKKKSK
jgi:hypothetical protein